MHTAKLLPPHVLHKRGRGGELVPAKPGSATTFDVTHHQFDPQERLGRDGLDDTTSVATSGGSDALLGLQDIPVRKSKSQLTSTEFALQEIRSRVRAIDERWEEVNVRATTTLDNINEDELDHKDPGRKRRSSDAATKKRKEADGKHSLRDLRTGAGIDLSRGEAGLLDGSHAAAWFDDIANSGRSVTRDDRVAVALVQSHENLAAAAVKFEESHERSEHLLGGLREWLDGFTGTARPEDTNPIAAMLPEPGMESEVVALMTDCQDAALMLEYSTNQHTAQLQEIFSQAGKLYGSEIDRVHKQGSATTKAAKEKLATLQGHANTVETLLNSMQEERATLQTRFVGAEQRCRLLEERSREHKVQLEEGLSNYRHRVIQLQHVVAGYEEKARKQEQLEREPRLAPVLEKLAVSAPVADSGQLRQLQADAARLTSENAALAGANKKLNRELVVLRLADQGIKRSAGRPKGKAQPVEPNPATADTRDSAPSQESLEDIREQAEQAQRELIEAKRENDSLSDRLQNLLVELEKEKQRPTVVNHPAGDAVEQGLREALRDLRAETNTQLEEEIEARRRAVAELESALSEAREKGEVAAAAKDEIDRLRSQLVHTQGKLRAVREPADIPKTTPAAEPAEVSRPLLQPVIVPPSPQTEVTVEIAPPSQPAEAAVVTAPASPLATETTEEQPSVLSPVDYGELVGRAVSQEEVELSELKKKAEDVGVAQRHYDKAQTVFSAVVDCCGNGLSSVEHIMETSTAIVDADACRIQEALAVALERAIASASVLLREALVGRIRACEAEKQASLEQETANEERAKALALEQEKKGLVDELQQHLDQAAELRGEIESLRQKDARHQQPSWSDQQEASLVVSPQPPADESLTWRRRYEHLASLLADVTKESSGKASRPTTAARVRNSPRPSPRPAAAHARFEKPTTRVTDGLSSISSPSSLSVVPAIVDTNSSAHGAEVVISTGVWASSVPPAANGEVQTSAGGTIKKEKSGSVDVGVGIVMARKASSDFGVQVGDSNGTQASDSAQVDDLARSTGNAIVLERATDIAARDEVSANNEANDSTGSVPLAVPASALQVHAASEDDTVDHTAKQVPHPTETVGQNADVPSDGEMIPRREKDGSLGGNSNGIGSDGNGEGNPLKNSGVKDFDGVVAEPQSASTVENNTTSKRSNNDIVGGKEDTSNSIENAEKDTTRRPRAENRPDNNTNDGGGGGTDSSSDGTDGARSRGVSSDCVDTNRGELPNNLVNEDAQTPPASDDHQTSGTVKNKHSAGNVDGGSSGSENEDIDEDELLDKLLDERAPSDVFKEDHQKLLNKLLRSREGEQVRNESIRPATPPMSARNDSVPQQSLPDQSAEVARENEKHLAAQRELEESERRIHSLTSDVASLKRKLAEYADVVRHARTFADEVVAAPGTEFPQAQAAQEFKELSENVGRGRGNAHHSSDSKSPKGRAAAAAASRANRRQRASPSPRSTLSSRSRANHRRASSTRAGGGIWGDNSSGGGIGASPNSRRMSRVNTTNNGVGSRPNSRGSLPGTAGGRRKSVRILPGVNADTPSGTGEGKGGPELANPESKPALRSTSIAEGSLVEQPSSAYPGGDGKGLVESNGRAGVVLNVTKEDVYAQESGAQPREGERRGSTDVPRAIKPITAKTEGTNASHVKPVVAERPEIFMPSSAGAMLQVNIEGLDGASCAEDGAGALSEASSPSFGAQDRINIPVTTATTMEADKGGGQPRSQDPAIVPPPATATATTRASPLQNMEAAQRNTTTISTGASSPATYVPSSTNPVDKADVSGNEGDSLLSKSQEVQAENHEGGTEVPTAGGGRQNAFIELEIPAGWTNDTHTFTPTEKSLVAYCEAAARCKMSMEAFETLPDCSPRRTSTQDSGAVATNVDEQLQQLAKRYLDLTNAMTEWGVEAAAALLVEITKTAAKLGIISKWAAANERQSGNKKSRGDNSVSQARLDRATLLLAQKSVLREVIEGFGGWEAAVFFDSGGVNLDVDLSAWPDDQVAILSALNEHLRDELEENKARQSETLSNLRGRLQVAQQKNEELRTAGLQSLEVTEQIPEVVEPLSPEVHEDGSEVEKESEKESEQEVPAATESKEKGKSEQAEGNEGDEEQEVEKPSIANAGDKAETMKEEQRQIQLQLTMAIASLKLARDDLRKEKERSQRAEQKLQQRKAEPIELAEENTQDKQDTMLQETNVMQQQDIDPAKPQQHQLPVQSPVKPRPRPPSYLQPAANPQPAPQVQQKVRPLSQHGITPECEVVQPSVGSWRSKKGLDLIAEADMAERRAKNDEEAMRRAGYPLEALAAERQAIADLRGTLTKAVCDILEICSPKPGEEVQRDEGDRLPLEEPKANTWRASRVGMTRGPVSTLVQMVCSGEEANVRCATAEYRLCTGVASRNSCGDKANKASGRHERPTSPSPTFTSPALPPAAEIGTETDRNSSRFREAATSVAQAGHTARKILRGFLDTDSSSGACATGESASDPSTSPSPALAHHAPPKSPRAALAAARVASAGVRVFSDQICKVGADVQSDGGEVTADGKLQWAVFAGDGGRNGFGSAGTPENNAGGCASIARPEGGEVDTTSTAAVVEALRADVMWTEVLPSFVRMALEAQAERLGHQASLKDREIEILSEVQCQLRRDLRALKADYVSADADDIIRALRTRVRKLNDKVLFLERQLQLTQQSSEVEGGAIEVLEGLLRQRDADKELHHGLCLKRLEVGLKIRLLETDTGGKTVEVSRLQNHDQRALVHLKGRLTKERGTLDVRKKTVATELERSLPHGMRAFERVSRAIQRLCNGYASLPGLLEWGRANAARLGASGKDADKTSASMSGDPGSSLSLETSNGRDPNGGGHFFPFRTGAATAAAGTSGRREPRPKHNHVDGLGSAQAEVTRGGTISRRLPVDGRPGNGGRGGVSSIWPSCATSLSFSSSAESFAGRAPPASLRYSVVPETSHKLPKMARGARDIEASVKDVRRKLKTAGHASGGGFVFGGIPEAVDQHGNDRSIVGTTSSVSSLLREEKAFRQRSDPRHRTRENDEGPTRGHTAHHDQALVPLNSVGLPVRFRQHLRRNQALQVAR